MLNVYSNEYMKSKTKELLNEQKKENNVLEEELYKNNINNFKNSFEEKNNRRNQITIKLKRKDFKELTKIMSDLSVEICFSIGKLATLVDSFVDKIQIPRGNGTRFKNFLENYYAFIFESSEFLDILIPLVSDWNTKPLKANVDLMMVEDGFEPFKNMVKVQIEAIEIYDDIIEDVKQLEPYTENFEKLDITWSKAVEDEKNRTLKELKLIDERYQKKLEKIKNMK